MMFCIEVRKFGRYYFFGSIYFYFQSYKEDVLVKDIKRFNVSKDVIEVEYKCMLSQEKENKKFKRVRCNVLINFVIEVNLCFI